MKMEAIGIAVADMATALAFYRALGLDIPEDADGEPHVQGEVTEGFWVMFDTHDLMRSFDPGWEPGTGTIGIAFDCGTPEEVDDAYARVIAAGYRSHLEPFDAFWGQRYASVYDPDGNAVDFAATLPSQQQPTM